MPKLMDTEKSDFCMYIYPYFQKSKERDGTLYESDSLKIPVWRVSCDDLKVK